MLSTSDLRRWFMKKTQRGKGKQLRQYDNEFATMAFLRHVGLKPRAFYKWLHGVEEQPRYMLQRLSRFVEDWESGAISFNSVVRHTQRRELVRLAEPRKMPIRLTVDLTGREPRLQFIAKPKFERMPDFPSLAGPLSLDDRRK